MSSSYNLFVVLALALIFSASAGTTPAQAQSAIESGKNYLFFTYDEIHAQEIINVKNPILKNKYEQCGVLYTNAVNALLNSLTYLKSRDYQRVVALAATALEDVRSCDRIFTPPGAETKFKGLSEKAVGVVNDLLGVVKGLA